MKNNSCKRLSNTVSWIQKLDASKIFLKVNVLSTKIHENFNKYISESTFLDDLNLEVRMLNLESVVVLQHIKKSKKSDRINLEICIAKNCMSMACF